MFGGLIGVGLLVLVILSIFKILKEYERGVIFLLGRFQKVKGPGIIIVVPLIQQMTRVDLRVIVTYLCDILNTRYGQGLEVR